MIYIDNRQNKIEVTDELEKLITEVVEFTLKEESVDTECEVSIILVDNEQIKELNNEFRNINKETDVLSFPMLDYYDGKVFSEVYFGKKFDESYMDNGCLILGDMAVSLEKTREQSIEFNHSFNRELAYLTVHSILHLLGYDHMNDDEKSVMRVREEHILNNLNIRRD